MREREGEGERGRERERERERERGREGGRVGGRESVEASLFSFYHETMVHINTYPIVFKGEHPRQVALPFAGLIDVYLPEQAEEWFPLV